MSLIIGHKQPSFIVQNNRHPMESFWGDQLPPKVDVNLWGRALAVALTISSCVAILVFNGALTSFTLPSREIAFAIGTLTIGAVIILRDVFSNPIFPKCLESVLSLSQNQKRTFGKLCGNNHWKEVIYYSDYISAKVRNPSDPKKQIKIPYSGYMDCSTLDEKGSGIAFVYAPKSTFEHYNISICVLSAMPIYAVATMAYNLIRTCLIPFYITLRALLQNVGLFASSSIRFKITDIPHEIAISIQNVILAPFYATALLFAVMYSFLHPLNGRKLASHIEFRWNKGGMREEGVWIFKPQKSCKFDGPNIYYLPGCWQPFAIVQVNQHYIEKAISTGSSKNPVDIYFSEDFQEITDKVI